jgi:hypothetical protein
MDTPLKFSIVFYIKYTPSLTSKATKKNMSGHEKNPSNPSKEYGHFIKGMALDYFKKFLQSL